MSRACLTVASIVLSLLVIGAISPATLTKGQSRPQLLITYESATNQPDFNNPRSLLIHAYGKFAKFIHSGNVWATKEGQPDQLDKDHEISFEIGDLESGPINQIYDSIIGKVVTRPGGPGLRVGIVGITLNGSEKVLFDAQWSDEGYSLSLKEDWDRMRIEDWDRMRIKEALDDIGKNFLPVNRYITYEVKCIFMKRERSYRAMAVYHSDSHSSERPAIGFFDYCIGHGSLINAFIETRAIFE
jgi:hypothetical protein